MEILIPIFLLLFIIWWVSQSRGVKHYKYSKASSSSTIDLRASKSIIYKGKDILKSPTTFKFDNRTPCYRIIETESKISNPTFHIDESSKNLLLFNSRRILNDSVRSKKFIPRTPSECVPLEDIISIGLIEKNENISFTHYLIDAGIDNGKIIIMRNQLNSVVIDKMIGILKTIKTETQKE